MSDFSVARPGSNNNASPDATAALELFYKKFAGEVMTTFRDNNIMLGKTMVRTISSGKSAAFPATGVAAAAYHVPGTELAGQSILGSERVISIDSLVVADVFVANIDEAMSEFEVRSIYSGECGVALANKIDENLLRILVLASRASATVTNGDGGTVITDADAKTNGASLAASVYAMAQAWDEKNVPAADRNGYFLPAQYYLMAQNTDLINKDWTGGNGDLAKGTIGSIGGIMVNKTNHVAVTNTTAVTGEVNSYAVADADNEVASFGQKRAIGTVKLLDLGVESEYSVRHQGTLLVAKYAMGHGILRPECAGSIKNG